MQEENKNEGFIKLYRSLLKWEWFDDVNTCHLFLYCLLRANHKTKKWHGIEIEQGQFISSIRKIAQDTGLSGSQVRTSLNKLKMTHEIAHETTSQYSIISIENWNSYQENDTPNDKRITNQSHTNDTRVATNNNDKNDKNEKNINTTESQKLKTDPFIENSTENYFKNEYQKVFNNKPYILKNQKEKLKELENNIEDFKRTIPQVLNDLNNIEFRFTDKPTIKPDYLWLLKDDNYLKILTGFYKENIKENKERKKIIAEMEARQ